MPRHPDGPAGQDWDPERYARNAGFVAELGGAVLDLLDPRPGERILDLGCGDGALTEQLAAAGADVVGVDSSAAQVAAARERGLDARVMDGESLTFAGEFDAVFSNAALHWMRRPEKVVAGVFRALRSPGRFVGEMGGAGNVQAVGGALVAALDRRGIDGAAADPWYFPDTREYRTRLEEAGFRVRSIALIPRPTPLPGDLGGWLETFAGSFLAAVPEADRPAVFAEVAADLAPRLKDDDGRWVVDYVRLRFAADKPAS